MVDLLTILNTINNYGIPLLISGMVLLAVWEGIKFVIAKLKRESDSQQKQVNMLTDMLFKVVEEKFGLVNPIDFSNDPHTDKIEDLLNALLQETDCDCCSVFSYHNGGTDMLGVPFQKMSCTNQKVRMGISPTANNFQAMYKSSLHYIVSAIKNTKHCYIDDIETLKSIDYGVYDILKQNNIKSMYCEGIMNLSGVIIGYVAISYKITPISKDDVDQTVATLKQFAHFIEGVRIAKE